MDIKVFKVGDRVEHKIFGKGTVVEVESGVANDSLLVQFDKKHLSLHNGNVCKGRYKDNTCWHFSATKLDDLKLLKFTKQDLLDAPIGTKITTNRGEILVKDDIEDGQLFENTSRVLSVNEIDEDFTIDGRIIGTKIVKVEVPIYSTVHEEKEIKEMTLKGIEEQLGYKIKIKGE